MGCAAPPPAAPPWHGVADNMINQQAFGGPGPPLVQRMGCISTQGPHPVREAIGHSGLGSDHVNGASGGVAGEGYCSTPHTQPEGIPAARRARVLSCCVFPETR